LTNQTSCSLETVYYRTIVPGWKLTNSSGNSLSGVKIASVNGYTCNDSSTIQVSNLKMVATNCSTGVARTVTGSSYVSDAYKVNCSSTTGCCVSIGANSVTDGYEGIPNQLKQCSSVDGLISSNSYVTGFASFTTYPPTISVCGATLTSGSAYKFTFKDTSSGCEYSENLTVQIDGSSDTLISGSGSSDLIISTDKAELMPEN
jgi:hypothetical protein